MSKIEGGKARGNDFHSANVEDHLSAMHHHFNHFNKLKQSNKTMADHHADKYYAHKNQIDKIRSSKKV